MSPFAISPPITSIEELSVVGESLSNADTRRNDILKPWLRGQVGRVGILADRCCDRPKSRRELFARAPCQRSRELPVRISLLPAASKADRHSLPAHQQYVRGHLALPAGVISDPEYGVTEPGSDRLIEEAETDSAAGHSGTPPVVNGWYGSHAASTNCGDQREFQRQCCCSHVKKQIPS